MPSQNVKRVINTESQTTNDEVARRENINPNKIDEYQTEKTDKKPAKSLQEELPRYQQKRSNNSVLPVLRKETPPENKDVNKNTINTDTAAPPTTSKEPAKSTNESALETGQIFSALNKNGVGYTLQLMASVDLDIMRDFVTRHHLQHKVSFYSAEYHGSKWHMLVYGNYANMRDAQQAIKQLPMELKKLNPWVKSMHRIKTEMGLGKVVG
jgi:septal ring-binding cell division protein DamX